MYKILIKKSAQKELLNISSPYSKKIADAIDNLATDPHPVGTKKLKGEESYRIRVSDYRIIYTIEDVIKIIEYNVFVIEKTHISHSLFSEVD